MEGFHDGWQSMEKHARNQQKSKLAIRCTSPWDIVYRQEPDMSVKRALSFGPPRCIKMALRSPDERLKTAADCLSRLLNLGPDPIPMPYEGHNLGNNAKPLFEDGTGPVLEPVGGEFQPQIEAGNPGGGAHLIFLLNRFLDAVRKAVRL
jgi:hypothetical protein